MKWPLKALVLEIILMLPNLILADVRDVYEVQHNSVDDLLKAFQTHLSLLTGGTGKKDVTKADIVKIMSAFEPLITNLFGGSTNREDVPVNILKLIQTRQRLHGPLLDTATRELQENWLDDVLKVVVTLEPFIVPLITGREVRFLF